MEFIPELAIDVEAPPARRFQNLMDSPENENKEPRFAQATHQRALDGHVSLPVASSKGSEGPILSVADTEQQIQAVWQQPRESPTAHRRSTLQSPRQASSADHRYSDFDVPGVVTPTASPPSGFLAAQHRFAKRDLELKRGLRDLGVASGASAPPIETKLPSVQCGEIIIPLSKPKPKKPRKSKKRDWSEILLGCGCG